MVASSSPSDPLTVILGATGKQGGSVLTHLLASDRPYRLRAITRDPTKSAGVEIKAKGVEVVAGDLEKTEDLERVFENAEIIFSVTNFWEHLDAEREVKDGQRIIDAAKKAAGNTLKLFIWSGAESVSKGSGGKITRTHHFDSKAVITEYGRASGIPFAEVQAASYYENFLSQMAPRKQPDGTAVLALPLPPNTKVSGINVSRDLGLFVRAAIESPELGAGSEVLAAGEDVTPAEVVEAISAVYGKKVKFVTVDDATFLSVAGPAGEDLLDMFKWYDQFGYYGGKDSKTVYKYLASRPQTFKEFAHSQDWSKVIQ